MKTTRRDFLTAAVAGAGTTAAAPLAGAQEQEHGHQAPPSDMELRVKAVEALLVEKGLVKSTELDAVVESYEHRVGPHNGAKVVARAWVDPSYKQRLLAKGDAAIAELGFGSGGSDGDRLIVLENSPKVHNLIV